MAFSSYLATPDTKAAEAFAPQQWRYRSSGSDDVSGASGQVPWPATQALQLHDDLSGIAQLKPYMEKYSYTANPPLHWALREMSH